MADYRKLAVDLIAADGKIDETEIKLLKKSLYADGKIDDEEIKFLLEVRSAVNKKATEPTPEFDKFFLKALTDNLLADGMISSEEVASMKKSVLGDKRLEPAEVTKFLSNLKKKATSVAPEFEKLMQAHDKKQTASV